MTKNEKNNEMDRKYINYYETKNDESPRTADYTEGHFYNHIFDENIVSNYSLCQYYDTNNFLFYDNTFLNENNNYYINEVRNNYNRLENNDGRKNSQKKDSVPIINHTFIPKKGSKSNKKKVKKSSWCLKRMSNLNAENVNIDSEYCDMRSKNSNFNTEKKILKGKKLNLINEKKPSNTTTRSEENDIYNIFISKSKIKNDDREIIFGESNLDENKNYNFLECSQKNYLFSKIFILE